MNQGLQTVKNTHPQVYDQLSQLMASMIKLTIDYEQKPLNNINKQFQDCIMNYFFEDFIGDLIKNRFENLTKNQIKNNFMRTISDEMSMKNTNQKAPFKNSSSLKTFSEKKYMLLPQKYIEEIINQKKESEYIQLLCQYILEDIRFSEGELRWRSQIRKKVFSALLLVHFYNGYPIQSIFEMWDNTFPTQSIKNKKKESKKYQKKRIAHSPKIVIEEKLKNQVSKNTSAQYESGKRKCSSIQIIEPPISKKSQIDHYFSNFPCQLQQNSSQILLGSNTLTPLHQLPSFQQQSVSNELETEQSEDSSVKFQSQDQSNTFYEESVYSCNQLGQQNNLCYDTAKFENHLFNQANHIFDFQNQQQESLIEKCQNFLFYSNYDYENQAYQDAMPNYENGYYPSYVESSLNSYQGEFKNFDLNMQYFS
ncbi:hypothetical protein TTHERM_00030530 (macronuclear) [Tetrahymena thermophila SB210]|uniref:Uncharacterized protein n=1 Tax=Tetrahymena thermophila (strain SB210) TaxID=312017 RepID=Q22MS0_TETTS|nr:hypothetical protein TTHERM_00030530 [Tetrahymena thermophila SB210]EAR86503.1 hypothetical protein TTHERM_00030530 [Tetrahymena thermophila SB210]|eukprot:XP_976950.1 hypothetical protein TTHERM_00030530 [Tetrahymena thermophila SB210]